MRTYLEGESAACTSVFQKDGKLSFVAIVCCRKRNGCVSTARPNASCLAEALTSRRCPSLILRLSTIRQALPVTRRRLVNRVLSINRLLSRVPRPRRHKPRSSLPVPEAPLHLRLPNYLRIANRRQKARLQCQHRHRQQQWRARSSSPKPLRRNPRVSLRSRNPKRPNRLTRKENPSRQ